MNFISGTLWPWVVLWWPWLLAGVTGIAALFGLWWLWWRLPKRQVERVWFSIPDAKSRADVEDNFRKTMTQLFALVGGFGAVAAAVIAYLQLFEQQKASHDLLISNQVSKGFEQLGSKEAVIRLGGIYALEGVMNTSEEYHQPVLEALSAFIRDKTTNATSDGPPASDIQAALTVIGRRERKFSGWRALDLANAHIPKANLIDAKLNFADLRGADLRGANLSGAHLLKADLDATRLGGVDLSHADLRAVKVQRGALNLACGENVVLDPGVELTIKPCQK